MLLFFMKNYVFIDESGDVGFGNRLKPHFVMVAIVIEEPFVELIRSKLDEYRKGQGWSKSDELKFSKTRKDKIEEALKLVKNDSFEIYNLVIHKNDTMERISGQNLYNSLLIRLLKEIDANEIVVKVDGKHGSKYEKKIKTFIRQQIRPKQLQGFSFGDSVSDSNLQLADLVAGALMAKLIGSSKFYNIIKNKNKSP